jgi:hypothetical protein
LRQGWSPVQGVLPTVYKIHSSRLILMGNEAEGPIWKAEKEENYKLIFTFLHL